MTFLKKWWVAFVMLTLTALLGCDKFIDGKPDKKLVVPETLNDFQALLDNTGQTNEAGPVEGEISTDDYYLTDEDLAALSYESDKRMYVWDPEIPFSDKAQSGWSLAYRTVYYCNTVLEGLEDLPQTAGNSDQWNFIRGQALYMRANCYFELAGIWALAYDAETAPGDLGLPLRLSTNFNEKSERSSLFDVFSQITADLRGAVQCLPEAFPSKWRASKGAAYGLLARCYLYMRDYEHAGLYADSCLKIYNALIDYNTLNTSANVPIALNNPEVIFNRTTETPEPINVITAKISRSLYNSYNDLDKRKQAFFRFRTDGSIRFKGSYRGSSALFSGIATDEMYLIRAECLARKGLIEDAMTDLNTLMRNRWKKENGVSLFTPFQPAGQQEAIDIILNERRKELLMRGTRWLDIKRLNKEGANISLHREVNSLQYILPPNDLRSALPVPQDVISLSGMKQNLR